MAEPDLQLLFQNQIKIKGRKLVWQRPEASTQKSSTARIAERLYFRVRNGYGCSPLAVAASVSKNIL